MSPQSRDRLDALSAVKRALLAKRRRARPAGAGALIARRRGGGPVPASHSQERMWLFQRMYPDAIAYNSQVAVHLKGRLDVSALEHSLDAIVSRHEIYRTTFAEADGVVTQRIHPPGPAHLQVVDVSGGPVADCGARMRQRIRTAIAQPFRLDELPLVRWTLIRLAPNRHVLVCMDHHAVTDGWSRNIAFQELMALYGGCVATGRMPDLPAPSIQFADFADWQANWMTSTEARAQLDYWTRQLSGLPDRLDLPYDRGHPMRPTFRGGHELMHLGEDALAPLRAAAARGRATMFMAMLAVFVVLLHRYTQSTDIAVGSGVANRRRPETHGLIGMLINTVVLRTDVTPELRFHELLARVRRVTLEAYSHQEAPFERVVEAVAPARRPGVNPLHQVTFNFQNNPMPAMSLSGIRTHLERPLFNGSAKFDLYVAGWPRSQRRHGAWQRDDEDVLLSWEYNGDVFDTATIGRMKEQFRRLVIEAGLHPEQPIGELPMEEASRRLPVSRTSTAVVEAVCPAVHRLFAAHATRTPDAVALEWDGGRWTYGELDGRASALAQVLIGRGVGPDVPVGVALDRSPDAIVALIAIWKAGGAYVPLDPALPTRRLQEIVATCRPHLVVSSAGRDSRLRDTGPPILLVDDRPGPRADVGWTGCDSAPEHLAYVLFTSGSTGTPRAVAVPHRAVTRLVHQSRFAMMDAAETWLHVSPLAFDASTLEIWAALANGGRLVLMPTGPISVEGVAAAIARHGVTSAWLTAGLFEVIAADHVEALDGLTQLLTGGDVVPVDAARRVLERYPDLRLVNGYGPTENTTFTCCHRVVPADLGRTRLPIGRPIDGTSVYLLDAAGRVCPSGVPGELWAGGLGLARGYLNDPEATAERFVDHPRYGRIYRTGDLCRSLPDGPIEFIRRLDRQVKVRGFRVDPAEVETELRQCPGVAEAVVEAGGETAADKVLVAYIASAAADAPPDIRALRGTLRERLPEHAVPADWRLVSAIPLTVNGKIDRTALRALANTAIDRHPDDRPLSELETIVADVVREVLATDTIGLHEDFFVAGGHSLAALRVVAAIKTRTGIPLEVIDLFQQPTVAGMAARAGARSLEAGGLPSPGDFLVELRPEGPRTPLFVLPGGWGEAGEILVFARLVTYLARDRAMYAVRSRTLDSNRVVPGALETQARDSLEAIVPRAAPRSFVLLGECAASTLTLEITAQAERMGKAPEAVILLDPGPISHLSSLVSRMPALARQGSSALPAPVGRYYRLLGSWEPRPVRTPVHLILSSRFPDVDAIHESWRQVAHGPLHARAVPGTHESYIRELAAGTAGAIQEILSGGPGRNPP